mmetsp:Transcript_9029/g.13568  ORF Transcript_9029/g.13568 Transcript_9029/m.13568 type:complete len:835 (+) Transcript_9029:91-2595(+)
MQDELTVCMTEPEESMQDMSEGVLSAFRSLVFSSFPHLPDLTTPPPSITNDPYDLNTQSEIGRVSGVLRGILYEFVKELSEYAEELDIAGKKTIDIDDVIDVANDVQKSWQILEYLIISPSNVVSVNTIDWLKGKVNDVDPILVTEKLDYYKSIAEPELSDLSNDNQQLVGGFWGLIFDLVLRGDLNTAWEVLSLHSEISALPDKNPDFKSLRHIFTSHPLCRESLEGVSLREMYSLWKEWHQCVDSIRAESPLTGNIPELDRLLRVMLGDKKTLQSVVHQQEETRNNWYVMSVSLLLFSQPALSRPDVGRVLEEGMRLCGGAEDEEERKCILHLFHGEVGPLLRSLKERGDGARDGAETQIHQILAAVILLAGTHLSRMLQMVGALETTGVQNEFLNTMATETVDILAKLGIPAEVINGYMHTAFLGSSAEQLARELLPRCEVTCDSDALDLSSLLREAGLAAESDSVLVSRGLYWLQRAERPKLIKEDSDSLLYRLGGMEAKALLFFLRGQDSSRARALLDQNMLRCVVSVSKFDNLKGLLPCAPGDMLKSLIVSSAPVEIGIASGILCAVNSLRNEQLCRSEVHALRAYVEVAQCLLEMPILDHEFPKLPLTDLISIMQSLGSAADSLKILLAPVERDTHPPLSSSCSSVCPQRYWTHIVDLCVWVQRAHIMYRGMLEVALKEAEDDCFEEKSQLSEFPPVLFSREHLDICLRMMHLGKANYLSNTVMAKSSDIKDDQRLHHALLQMVEAASCYENYCFSSLESSSAGAYSEAQQSKYSSRSVASGEGTSRSLALHLSRSDPPDTISSYRASRFETYLTAPASSSSLRMLP